jgi:hypothetical protein
VRPSFSLAAFVPLALVLPVACGGSAFEAGGPAPDSGGTLDSGAQDSGSPGDSSTASDSPASDSAPTDASTPDSPAPPAEAGACSPLTSASTDIYVDSRFTGTPATGAQSCPLHTIQLGLAAAKTLGGPRTVHVAGFTPALVYDETGPLTVGPGITLQGAGVLTTTISASGSCMTGNATGTCAVIVQGGGIVDGFTIVSPGGDGLWTLPPGSSPTPLIRNIAASGSKNDGIVAYGSVDLGPNIGASQNGNAGVESPAGSTGVVHVLAGVNGFNANKGNGIDLSGAASLTFEGGTASGDFQGVRLASNPPASHSITGLTAKSNTGTGVVVYGGQTLKVRSSTFVGNAGSGLYYAYVGTSTLDLGTSGASGGNVFGGATGRNTTAGLTLCNAPASQLADGDSWVSCQPTQTAIVCGTITTGSYTDVAYQYETGVVSTGGPISGSCSVGP